MRSSLGVGTPWRRGLGSKARSVREHARAKCVRNATRGRESSARLLPHRFLQPRSPPRPTRDSPHFYTHTRQNRVESKKKGERREFGADFRLVSTPSRHSIVAVFLRLIRVASDRSTILLLPFLLLLHPRSG